MATEAKSPYLLLVTRAAREAHKDMGRAYRKACRELARDAELTESEAAKHLADVGITEPKAPTNGA